VYVVLPAVPSVLIMTHTQKIPNQHMIVQRCRNHNYSKNNMRNCDTQIPFCEKIVQLVCRNDVIDEPTVKEIRTLLNQHTVPKNAPVMVDLTVPGDKDYVHDSFTEESLHLVPDGQNLTSQCDGNLQVIAGHQRESTKRKSPDNSPQDSKSSKSAAKFQPGDNSPVRALAIVCTNTAE
jgi:hypothetical protein